MASRQPRHVEEIKVTTEHNPSATSNQQQQHNDDNRGVIGSVMKAVHDTYENAREAVVGKRDPATTEEVHVFDNDNDLVSGGGEVRDISANKSRGVYDATKEKTNEYADYTAEKAKEAKNKAGEYKDYAAEKAKEGKDATMNKMGEYKDYTAEKAKEGKDNTAWKIGEMKDSAVDAAKRAMGYLGDKKEETKEKTAETAEAAKQKTAETTEAAKQKTAETTEAAKQKTAEAKDKTKEMMSGAEEEARRRKDKGFGEETWRRGNEGVIRTEDTRTGTVAGRLKAADQMTGQTFNDVGPLDDEGVTRVGLLDIKKK
ncbi:unnamed protein product [Trifolium pratense]|uniref:Uncharacterized protein n=1 Tax=Trifolium pratense TaxID=57577 RepID=A0ACB0LSY3_TRIPR|nr:unnamed protein product [Trifolium pratense]